MNENTRKELLRLWQERPEFKPETRSVFQRWDAHDMEITATGQIVDVLAHNGDDDDASGGPDTPWYLPELGDAPTLLDALIAAAFASPPL